MKNFLSAFPDRNWVAESAVLVFSLLYLFNKAVVPVGGLHWLATGVFCALALVRLARGRERSLILLLSACLAWHCFALLAGPWALVSTNHYDFAAKSAVLFLASALLVYYWDESRIWALALTWLLVTWLCVGGSIWVARVLGLYVEGEFYSGFFKNRNDYAIATVILYCLYLRLVPSRTLAKALFAGPVLGLVYATGSLTGLLAFIFVFAGYLFMAVAPARRWQLVLLIVLGCALIFAASPGLQKKAGRVSAALFHPEQIKPDSSYAVRLFLYREGLTKFAEQPWAGYGVDNSRFLLFPPGERYSRGLYAHSNFIETLVNTGLLGFALHYLPLLWVVCSRGGRGAPARTFALLYLLLSLTAVTYSSFAPAFLYAAALRYKLKPPAGAAEVNPRLA